MWGSLFSLEHPQTQKHTDTHITQSALIIHHMWCVSLSTWMTDSYMELARLPEQCMRSATAPNLRPFKKMFLNIMLSHAISWFLWLLNNLFLSLSLILLCVCTIMLMRVPVCSIPVWCRVSAVLAGPVEAGPLWWVLRPPAACTSHPQCGVVGGLRWRARRPAPH